tara:strand:- start:309 stop:656 length:348 start_codon:yes stop_codon:yes gene_type:complete
MIKALIQTKGQEIQVLRPVRVRDSVGSKKTTYLMLSPIKGYVASRSMTESFEGDRQQAEEIATLYVSGESDIKVDDRFKLDDRTFEITGVRTPGMRTNKDRLFYKIIDATSNEGV